MDWLSEVNKRYRRNNQILFSKESEYLQDLRMLFEEQDHKTMVLWAMDFAAESVAVFPIQGRFRNRLAAAAQQNTANSVCRAANVTIPASFEPVRCLANVTIAP